jgi:hypothetical protein
LHDVLNQGATLPSSTKETRFFDLRFHRGTEWYLAHFPEHPEKPIRGEVAPTYFACPAARERVARLIPSVKVVCIFRNPVDRILSLYRLKRAYAMSPWNFEQAIVRDPELIESGKYATHLKAWQKALGSDRVLAMVYEDLRRNPQGFLDAITTFIDVPRIVLSQPQLRFVHGSESLTHPRSYMLTRAARAMAEWCKSEGMERLVTAAKRRLLLKILLRSGEKFEAPSPGVSAKLYDLFRPEIEELEEILKRKFPAWKAAPQHLNPAV